MKITKRDYILNFYPDYVEGHEIVASAISLLYFYENFGEKETYKLMRNLFDETDVRRNVLLLFKPWVNCDKSVFRQLEENREFIKYISTYPTLTQILKKAKEKTSVEEMKLCFDEYYKEERKFFYRTFLPIVYSKYYLEPFLHIFQPTYFVPLFFSSTLTTFFGLSFFLSREIWARLISKIGKRWKNIGKKLFRLEQFLYKYTKLSLAYIFNLSWELVLSNGLTVFGLPIFRFGLEILGPIPLEELFYWIWFPHLLYFSWRKLKSWNLRRKMKDEKKFLENFKNKYRFQWREGLAGKIWKCLNFHRFPLSKSYYFDGFSFRVKRRIKENDVSEVKKKVLEYLEKIGWIKNKESFEKAKILIDDRPLSGKKYAIFVPLLIFWEKEGEVVFNKEKNNLKALCRALFESYKIIDKKDSIIAKKGKEEKVLLKLGEGWAEGELIDILVEKFKKGELLTYFNPIKKRVEIYYPLIFIWSLMEKKELHYHLCEEFVHLSLLTF